MDVLDKYTKSSSVLFPNSLRCRMPLSPQALSLVVYCYAISSSKYFIHSLKDCNVQVNGFCGTPLSQESEVMISRPEIFGHISQQEHNFGSRWTPASCEIPQTVIHTGESHENERRVS